MPEANKITKEDPKVDIDTSGPEVDVTIVPEDKSRKPLFKRIPLKRNQGHKKQ